MCRRYNYNFKELKNRYPTPDEVMSEMDNKGSIELIQSILKEKEDKEKENDENTNPLGEDNA